MLFAWSLLALTGCSWWRRAPVAEPRPLPPVLLSEAAARAACPNYDRVMRETLFPRAAIMRGIDNGRATLRFQVIDTKVRALSVDATDPAFGEAAFEVARQFQCHVDEPTTFEVPLAWRTSR